METKTSISSLIVYAIVVLSVTSCATTSGKGTSNASTSTPENVTYTVKPGDNLGDIALRLTGQFSNWQTIATHNGIDDPRTLAAGNTILIPGTLLSRTFVINTQGEQTIGEQVNGRVTPAASLQATNQKTIPVTTGNSVSVAGVHTAPGTTNETAQITITPVEINRSFELKPMDDLSLSDLNIASDDSKAPRVRVIGTYYPRGIYEQPADYARLIRRAAPGTLFQLESEVNDWYKIVVDDGFAYIRRSDSALAEPEAN